MTRAQFIRGAVIITAFTVAFCVVLHGPGHSNGLKIPRFQRGKLVCAKNVNALLQLNGRPTSKSNLAKSFLRFRRVSTPMPGDVAVCDRGGSRGHASLVWSVNKGVVTYLNPSSAAQGWKLTTRRCARFIAYVRM